MLHSIDGAFDGSELAADGDRQIAKQRRTGSGVKLRYRLLHGRGPPWIAPRPAAQAASPSIRRGSANEREIDFIESLP